MPMIYTLIFRFFCVSNPCVTILTWVSELYSVAPKCLRGRCLCRKREKHWGGEGSLTRTRYQTSYFENVDDFMAQNLRLINKIGFSNFNIIEYGGFPLKKLNPNPDFGSNILPYLLVEKFPNSVSHATWAQFYHWLLKIHRSLDHSPCIQAQLL